MEMPEIENEIKEKPKTEIFRTSSAPCKWAKVLKPFVDQYHKDGAYAIDLEFNEDDASGIMNEIRDRMVVFKDKEVGAGRTVKGWSIHRGFKKNDELNNYIFSFTQNAVYNPADGEALHFSVDVFDSQLNPWPKEMLIGNGSLVKVAYSYYPWNVSVQGGIGMTLKLRGVQVLEHIPYEAAPRTHGFTAESGFVVDNPMANPSADSSPEPSQLDHGKGPVVDGVPF